jgi:hypothetical protein
MKIKRETDATGIAAAAAVASASTAPTENPVQCRLLGLSGALNTVAPCAACKLLRRRCAQECPFAPYFSPHEPHKFAEVHKVFGASNVSKMLLVRLIKHHENFRCYSIFLVKSPAAHRNMCMYGSFYVQRVDLQGVPEA